MGKILWSIIIINTAVFVLMAYDAGIGVFLIGDEDFLDRWRAVPVCFTGTISCDDDYVIKPLTSMFVHGGVIHLVFNMFILSVFGFGLENRIGKVRFILIYLVSGFAGFGFMVLLEPNNTTGVIGASGAVSGVLGACMMLFPKERTYLYFIPMRMGVKIFLWFAIYNITPLIIRNFIPSFFDPTVAYIAHIGGFIAGTIIGFVLYLKIRKYNKRFD